jgi:phage terminase large subunit-like protein
MSYSEQHAAFACNFFEKILKHTADEWYGKPFLLAPWEEAAICEVFGNVDADGNRIIETVYLEVPKKTGKTELAAGLVLLVLFTARQPGCQVYGAASATRQAMNVYIAACKMVEQSSELRGLFRLMRGTNRICKRTDPDSFYAAVAADGDFGDGVNPACVIADEIHRWKTRKHRENWDVLVNGGITRRQTLTIAITTAGVQNESPIAWMLHEKTRKIKEGVVEDPKFWGRIYAADPTDDPADPKTWIKANPSLKENGGFLDISAVREKYDSFVAEGDLTPFRRYFLNLWDQKEDRAVDMVKWAACPSAWTAQGLLTIRPGESVRPIHPDLLAYFKDRPCFAGVDAAYTTDMAAVVFVFPRDDGGIDLLPFYWMPEANIRQREIKDGMPYRQWVEQGFVEASEGEVIAIGDMKKRIHWGAEVFSLKEACFDRYGTREISTQLIDEGIACTEVPQTFGGLSEATKKLLSLIKCGKVGHGNHPVMRYNASCLTTRGDGNDNIRPVKPHREKEHVRIDGATAAITALARMSLPGEQADSVYENAETAVI